jgi:hypothetical protein
LTTGEAEDGFRFGYQLGRADEGFSFLSDILDAQLSAGDSGNLFFLGGYLRAVAERDQTRFEKVLDNCASNPTSMLWIPELTSRSGRLTEMSADRILRMAEKGEIRAAALRVFMYGGLVKQLSEDQLRKWIHFLTKSTDSDAVGVALDLCHMYGHGGKTPVPVDVAINVLSHPTWRAPREGIRGSSLQDYEWCELAQAVISRQPGLGPQLARLIIENMGEEDTIFAEYSEQMNALLSTIASQSPDDVWPIVEEFLGPPMDTRSFYLRQWLWSRSLLDDGRDGALSIFPRKYVWEWIAKDPEPRARYLASFAPKDLGEKDSLMHELLVRYGDREDVRNSIHANYSSESWTGPASDHFKNRRNEFLALRNEEKNPAVVRWLDEHVERLSKEIEQAKFEEERED